MVGYLIAIQENTDNIVHNVLCYNFADFQKFIANLDSDAYLMLGVTALDTLTTDWANYCSKNTNLERG